MRKIIKIFLLIIAFVFASFFIYFFVGYAPENKDILWGVNFSQMGSENLGLDWKKNYIALLNDMKVRNIKLITNWDYIENEEGKYYFEDIDWQVHQAELYGAKLIFVLGIKSGRWPECHNPKWTESLDKEYVQKKALDYASKIILRYKNSKAIEMWQVENEPFFVFGKCPSWYYDGGEFIKKEIALVRSLDSTRPILVSDSGEQSMWLKAAWQGDIVGTTMYINAWWHITDSFGFYVNSILPPVFYYRKAKIIEQFFKKDVIGVELQAEPWASRTFYDVPISEQEKTMSLEKFKKNVEYAKNTGLKRHYLWGSEWWYWMKEVQVRPEIWNEAKKIFN